MKDIKLTAKGKAAVIGFKGAAVALKERSEADLKAFLINAYRVGRKSHIDLFDDPPTLPELLAEQTDAALAAGPQVNAAYSPHAMMLPAGVEVKPAATGAALKAVPDVSSPSTAQAAPTAAAGNTGAGTTQSGAAQANTPAAATNQPVPAAK